jgi:DNA-binding XRE family transcriptional regulator
VLALLSDEQEYGDYGWTTYPQQAEWLKEWRRRLSLSTAKAARVLGYEDAAAIETIENGRSLRRVRRDPVRQQKLAEERWGEAIHDRVGWLKGWRKQLGITQWETAQILGYSHQNEISRVERRHYQPAWEKILVAIEELDHRSLGRDFRRTEQPR